MNKPNLVTADDVGAIVTLRVKPVRPGKWFYVSGIVRAVSAQNVTVGVMRHPTGPWDKWEPYEAPAVIEHRRIMRRA
jgi:hypothetical protein